MIIEFKDKKVLQNCFRNGWHPKLIEVMVWILENFSGIIMTEAWRLSLHGGDVHCTNPLRAFDLRSWVFKDPKLVETKINQAWEYDSKRPEKNVAWFHDSGYGSHFHIQVHPNTQRRI